MQWVHSITPPELGQLIYKNTSYTNTIQCNLATVAGVIWLSSLSIAKKEQLQAIA